ncbi:MAG: hypothetical protein K8S62_00640 [Candidatus Sabulitectum sp.]|nr:hypothetical protein [Candidatus Sabulitectum sp.]
MLILLLLSSIVTPPGEAAAMDVFTQGRLNLVYIGQPGSEAYRDRETGLLLESWGGRSYPEAEQFCKDWNDYVLNLWSYLGSDSTCFVVRDGAESLEYRDNVLVYRDSWGSAPIEIFPEDLASLAEISRYSLRDSFENIVYLEMYTPLWDDTLNTEIPLYSPVIVSLFDKGRREIRRNQIVE